MSSDHNLVLTAGPLVLRPFALSDAEPLYGAIRGSYAELRAWMGWCHEDYSFDETETFLRERPGAHAKLHEHSFLITDGQSGAIVGCCGTHHVDLLNRVASIGYWIRTSATGRGVATAAATRLIRLALEELQYERVEIVVAVGNLSSRRVAEKLGAKLEGIARRRVRLDDVQHDAAVYSVVRSDWKP